MARVSQLQLGLDGISPAAIYRPPAEAPANPGAKLVLPTRRETTLTIMASFVWALFNAAYVVYLSFAPLMLTIGGYAPLKAAAVIPS